MHTILLYRSCTATQLTFFVNLISDIMLVCFYWILVDGAWDAKHINSNAVEFQPFIV